MNARRQLLLQFGSAALALSGPGFVQAAQRQSLADPLRLAVDDALIDSGLGPALQRAFGRETGVAVQLLRGPATSLLEALERGEHDAALTNAPDVETALDRQGLVHDRRRIAASDFIVVGPAALAKSLDRSLRDVGSALARLSQLQAPFLSRPDGSGTHLAELAAWRAAATAPGGGWYQTAQPGRPLVAQASERHACTLIERGVWAATGPVRGMKVLAGERGGLSVDIHVMRTFRAERQHPAGKLFVAWLSGKGRRLAESHRGYRAARAP